MKNQTYQNFSYIFSAFLALLLITSCASREDIAYFSETGVNNATKELGNYTPTLSADDLLEVSVAAIDMQAVGPFNGTGIDGDVSASVKKTYLIDQNGEIEFPIIGVVKLAGLTRLEATDVLKEEIEAYVKNPIVNLKIVNFKITVLGEVAHPGTFNIDHERVTILEALGLAGDMTIFGERQNVLVIREQDGKKSYTRVDLTTDEVFKSPVYYLTQNDVLYIEPNGDRMNQSKSNLSAIALPIIGILLSAGTLAILITRD